MIGGGDPAPPASTSKLRQRTHLRPAPSPPCALAPVWWPCSPGRTAKTIPGPGSLTAPERPAEAPCPPPPRRSPHRVSSGRRLDRRPLILRAADQTCV